MSNQTSAGNPQHLRRLLPAQDRTLPATTARASSSSRLGSVTAACIACRKHKVKCSGQRPTCRRCENRRIRCVYTTRPGETPSQAFTRNASVFEDVFDLLRNLPDEDARDVLQWIRSGTDAATVLNHVKTGSLLLQMAVSPESRLRYEFPYQSELPRYLLSNNPYLESLIYESATLTFGMQSLAEKSGSYENQSLYLKPFHAAEVVEPGLSDVKISSWTMVCNNDLLLRDLLRVWLRCEYHFTSAFQKDLFLEDMATRREDFCSSLLVNIVLACACVCYPRFSDRAEYWNPQTLVYRFVAEARRIWDLEASEARITTIQAGILFSVFHNLCGLDEIGKPYRVHAVALANRLRLFDNTIGQGSDRMRKGIAFTAWTLYNWETLTGFSFMHPPHLQKIPEWPLPDPSEDAHWYGEIYVRYPLDHSLLLSHFGHVFRAKCQFRIIMNDFCHAAFSKGRKLILEEANRFRERLRSWFDGLPESLLPRNIVLPGHLQLHIYYHHLILAIYEPLLDVDTDQVPSPNEVVAEAKRNLQTLIRLYYLRHGFEAMDLFIVIPLMITAYDCVSAIDEQTPENELEDLRSTLILAAQGLYNQRRNHYLATALFRVIQGSMRPVEVGLLRGTMDLDEEQADTRWEMSQAVRSHWPVGVVRKIEDVDSHILTNLVAIYGHMNIEERQIMEEVFPPV